MKQPDWLSTDEVAAMFGMTIESVRTNFPRQYDVRPVGGRWLRVDVLRAWMNRRDRGRPRKAA